jgi:hypothetical protein
MNRSRRLALIKTILMVMTTYVSIYIGLPPWMHKALEKIMKAFLWIGIDIVQGGKCLLAWKRVQRPMQLGILDHKLFGSTLHSCWLWLQ